MSTTMQERYGAPRPGRRRAAIAGTVALAVAFGGWLAWAAWFHSEPPISATIVRSRIVDANLTQVQLKTNFRNDDVRGACLVQAMASDYTVVGERSFDVATLRAAGGGWLDIRTERRSTAVEIKRCAEATQD